MRAHCLIGLDIGTATVKVAVAENRNGRPALQALFKEPSAGVRRGIIVELAEATQAIARALGEAKKVSKSALKSLYVNIGTHQTKVQPSRGIVAVSRADSEIYQDDVDRAVKASQAVNLAPNRIIVHNVTREYIVDGVGDILDPLGLSGNRLEVQSLVIDAFAPHVKNVMRVVELAGGQIGGLVMNPLLPGRSSLSKAQKDLGVAVIDIGCGTTSMSVYEENKLVDVNIFPVGAGHITSDLATGLRIPVAAAERVKLHSGYAVSKEINPKEMVDLAKFSSEAKGSVSRRFIAEIIEARLAEIFEFIDNRLKVIGKSGQLPGGAVFVGGGAKLPGLTELALQELRLSSQIGLMVGEEWAKEMPNFSEAFEDPEFANALGLVLWGSEKEGWHATRKSAALSLKELVRHLLP